MNELYIKATQNTPRIHLNAEKEIFEISGASFSEDVTNTYELVTEWIDENIPKFEGVLTCKFHFNVINSFSHKKIFNFLIKLNNLAKVGKKISIEWVHDIDDEDIMEMGEDLNELIDLPFSIKSKSY